MTWVKLTASDGNGKALHPVWINLEAAFSLYRVEKRDETMICEGGPPYSANEEQWTAVMESPEDIIRFAQEATRQWNCRTRPNTG